MAEAQAQFLGEFMAAMKTNTEMMNKMMEVMAGLATNQATSSVRAQPTLIADLSGRIQKFEYDPSEGYQFTKWYERHEGVLTVDGISLDDASRVRLLMEKLCDDAFAKYKRQILPKMYSDLTFDETIKVLKQMFDTQTSVHAVRYKCMHLRQDSGEETLEYTGRVNEVCEKAKIQYMKKEDLKCLLWICGLQSGTDPALRAKLLSFLDKQFEDKKDTTLHELYMEWDRLRTIKSTARVIDGGLAEVKAVHTPHKPKNHNSNLRVCFNCERPNHMVRDCRAPKSKCSKCNREGHKEKFCRGGGSTNRSTTRSYRKVNAASVETAESEAAVNAARRFAVVKVNEIPVEFQIDTGADVTLFCETDWEMLGKPHLSSVDMKVKGVGGEELSIRGVGECDFCFHDIPGHGKYYVVPGRSLLGLEWLEQNDVTRRCMNDMVPEVNAIHTADLGKMLKEMYPQVFADGLGKCTKEQARLQLLPDAQPKFIPKRAVPHAALTKVEEEIDRLLEMGVIEPVTHSEWAAPIVAVQKQTGKVRVCIDFSTGLNRALQNVECPIPVIEDIFASLNGARVFSQIDFSDAYLQVELCEESKDLVVVNTHRGVFRYNRLPFGIKTAPAIFQSIMTKMCSGLKGVDTYLDDVIVVGATQQEHDTNLVALFEGVQDYGFRVKLDICSFRKKEIKFLGYMVDSNGRRPNPEKVKAILDMKEPGDVPQLRSFLGMVTHYANFVSGMKDMRGPLDKLLRKDMEWKWNAPEQQAFDKLKKVLGSDLNLSHFDPKVPICVAADASAYGIGAVIVHKYPDGTEKPIAHASRSLTAAEKNYSQIEKEGLALIYAVKKFHKYIYGRKFLLPTDHKPLLGIFGSKKGVPVHSANRLMRWSLVLTAYDFEIVYVNTLEFGQADALSRLMQKCPVQDNEDIVIAKVESEVNAMFKGSIRKLPVTAEDVKVETANDPVLRQVLKCVKSGTWPKKVGEDMKSFFSRQTSLSVINECLMDGERVIVPSSLRKAVLKELHQGHPGIVQMKGLARSITFWPGMDKDCEAVVKGCVQCQEGQKTPAKVPLNPWPEPHRVWQRIHIDYAGPVDGVYYLVIVDAKSRWPEIFITKEITAAATVRFMTQVFARFGYPEVIVSDNGTQFVSELFERMCLERGIQHMRTAPYHPQSNGQAERFVDILKRGIKKLKGEGMLSQEALDELLLSYRSTPRAVLKDQTPAEVFVGRKLRTRVSLLIPSESSVEELSHEKKTMADQFNSKHGVKERKFEIGDTAMTKWYTGLNWKWKFGTVVAKTGAVQYEVSIDGQRIRRHANQMRKVVETDKQAEEHDFWSDLFEIDEPRRKSQPSRENVSTEGTIEETVVDQPVKVTETPVLRRSKRVP